MKMLKKVILSCFTLMFCFTIQNVKAASTCSYEEQVELNNLASTVKTGYEIKRVVTDMDGNILSNIKEEEVTEDSAYVLSTRLQVYVTNITNDIYIKITSDKGLDKTYKFSDTNNGEVNFDGGDLTEIVNYQVTVYSNKEHCSDELYRTIDFVTPMKNPYSSFTDCEAIPNYEYCQQYITTPFLATEYEIQSSIDKEYQKTIQQKKEEEVQKEKSFFEKLQDFYNKNKIILYSILGVVVIAGVLTTIVILKKRRSRIL